MAAFPFQELPFLVDCAITPEMMMKLSSSSSSSTTSTTNNSPLLSPSCCFSEDHTHLLKPNTNFSEPIFEQLQFHYPFENLADFHQGEANPIDFNLHESSCVEQGGTPMANSENDTPKKQSIDQNGGGVARWIPVKNKRKIKLDGSSPNPSKALRGGRSKKLKNCKNEAMKEEKEDEEVNKIKEQKKVTFQEAPKGYIHVRARRGQATDSHSLAERVRREKISERMKFLQSLVPGCDKVIGKATMLDEIINYVQSLQTQVEFLSMKLSSVTPMVYSFGVDLDALLLEQQGLNNMAPALQSVQECNPATTTTQTPTTAPATTAATTYFHHPQVGFQQQVHRGGANPPYLEDNAIGNLYWGLGDQGGSDPISQPGFNNMMHSF
ncbi:hypothetical protein V2J09_011910 [Rumex salicifolius]